MVRQGMIEASVIIASYNRAGRLRACLERLAAQAQPASKFEVVVVVDGSTDETRGVLAAFRAPYALRAVWQSNQGQCAALNRGAAAARGRTCIFLDDDVLAGPGLVAEHVRLHRERRGVVGVGKLPLAEGPRVDWFADGLARAVADHYAALDARQRCPTWLDCFGGNMSVARETFLSVGGFDAGLPRGYDVELAYRLARRNHSFVYLPKAWGWHDDRKGYRALTRDAEQAGAVSVELLRRYPEVLPCLLGAFSEQRAGTAWALRILLTLDVPPSGLEGLGGLLARGLGSGPAYRLLHRYGFWRGVRHAWPDADTWTTLIGGTPILMYHAFGTAGEPPSRYVVPIRRFEQQLEWLRRNACHVLSLEDLLDYRRDFRLPPARSVVLTIDDGYADTWSLAYPILGRYDCPATVFPVSGGVGSRNNWDTGSPLSGRPLLTWSSIEEMAVGGIRFGAHTRTHPDLTAIPVERAREEIEGSREELAGRLGSPILSFAYPYGKLNPEVASLADQAGYLGSCGIDPGRNTPATSPYALRRVEVRGTDSLHAFALAARFGTRVEILRKKLWHSLARSATPRAGAA